MTGFTRFAGLEHDDRIKSMEVEVVEKRLNGSTGMRNTLISWTYTPQCFPLITQMNAEFSAALQIYNHQLVLILRTYTPQCFPLITQMNAEIYAGNFLLRQDAWICPGHDTHS